MKNPVWRQSLKLGNVPFSPRDGASIVKSAGKNLLMLGGWNSSNLDWVGTYNTTNEIWASPDDGKSWTQILPYDAGATNRPAPGHTPNFCGLHNGLVYRVGGDPHSPNADVWSTPDGTSWTHVSNTAPTSTRLLGMGVSYKGRLYIMGGQTDLDDSSSALNDVWSTGDGGVTWTNHGNAPWPARGVAYYPTVMDGLLYLIGGGVYNNTSADEIYYNDVWTFDGDSWNCVLANGHTQWLGRIYVNTKSVNGRLWVITGYNGDNLQDIYYSDDKGKTWTQWDNAGWYPSHADGIGISNGKLIRATGNGTCQSVYQIELADGLPILNDAPSIQQVTPAFASVAGGDAFEINGFGFDPNPAGKAIGATIGGIPIDNFGVVDDLAITGNVPVGLAPGFYPVTVSNNKVTITSEILFQAV